MQAHYHTGKEDELIALDGSSGRSTSLPVADSASIETVFAIDALLAGLPETESARLKLLVTPAPLTEAEQLAAEASGE